MKKKKKKRRKVSLTLTFVEFCFLAWPFFSFFFLQFFFYEKKNVLPFPIFAIIALEFIHFYYWILFFLFPISFSTLIAGYNYMIDCNIQFHTPSANAVFLFCFCLFRSSFPTFVIFFWSKFLYQNHRNWFFQINLFVIEKAKKNPP